MFVFADTDNHQVGDDRIALQLQQESRGFGGGFFHVSSGVARVDSIMGAVFFVVSWG